MALILEPTRVLLESNDASWYWLSLSQEGLVVPRVDTTPVVPPVGANPYAVIEGSNGSTYRLRLNSVSEGTLHVTPRLELSPGPEPSLAALPLVLDGTNYLLDVLIEDGVPLVYITIGGSGFAPIITGPPVGGAYNVGDSFTLTVEAAGTEPLTYQWYKDGIAISGATTTSLVLSNVTTTDSGAYTVTVTNEFGEVESDEALITVTFPSPQGDASGLPIIAGTLPPNYCWPASPQQFMNDIAALMSVSLDVTGARYVLSQSTTPNSSQRDFVWHNPSTGHVLTWNPNTTRWEQPHPIVANSPLRSIWVGTTSQLLSFDGGDGAANPMWVVDTVIAGRMPIAAGNLPGSGTAVLVNATGGSDQITIAKSNLPAVKIPVNTAIVGQTGVGAPEPVVGSTYGSTSLPGAGRAVDGTSTDVSGRYYTKGETDDLGTGTPTPMISPYYGVYIIKRSGRVAYWS